MLCDGCKQKQANIVLHMVTNGQVSTRSLCAQCAQKAHSEMSRAFATMGMQMEGLQGMVERAREERDSIPRMMCTNCRTAYNDIGYHTVFGCPRCYNAFHGQVMDYLSSLRQKHRPQVEAPEALLTPPEPTREELDDRLAEALQAEDYEQAAALRDRIQEMTASQGDAPDA